MAVCLLMVNGQILNFLSENELMQFDKVAFDISLVYQPYAQ